MVRQLLHALSGFLLVRIITAEVAGTEDGVPLFERYLVGRLPKLGRWGGGVIYLHHYLRSDPDLVLSRGLPHIAVMSNEVAVFGMQAEAGLVKVNQHARTLLGDSLEGAAHEFLAIAADRAENVAVRAA